MLPLECFSWLSSIAGICPFRMGINRESGELKMFPVCFSTTEAWWFSTILIVQISYFYITYSQIWPITYKQLVVTGHDTPTLVLSSFGITIIHLGLSLIPRILLFRLKPLSKAFASIHRVDRQIKQISQQNGAITNRFVWGSLFSFVWAGVRIVNFYPLTAMIMKENMQCVFYSMVYQYFSIVQVCIWCNLHHICYQSVAFRIGQLTSYLKTELKMRENNQGDSIKRPALRDKMETVHLTFNELCRASRKLNAAFSFETFLYLCCSFVILTSSLHILISDLSSVSDKTFGIDIRFGEIVTCLMISMAVLFILTNADLPAAQASKLRDVVMDLSGRTQDPVEKQEIMAFLMVLKENRLKTSAAGFFTIGMALAPNFIGSVATCLIILLQTSAETDNNIFMNVTHSLLSGSA